MHILLYSDLQLHPWKEFSKTVDGVNDRLADHIHALDQILDYAIQNNIKHIFFGGDMFEARAKVDVVAAKLLSEWKWKVSKAGITQVDIIGNHDLVDKSTTHNAIDLYRNVPNQYIITEPQWFPVGKFAVMCVPYMHRLEDMKEGVTVPCSAHYTPTVGIVHYGLYETPMESRGVIRDLGYDTEGQMRLADLTPALSTGLVKRFFFGHFHVTTNVTDKVHFIGTPLQHKWGERSVDTRFLDIDLSNSTFKGIPTSAPRFVEFQSIQDVVASQCKGNFCRVFVDDFEQQEVAKELLTSYGARGAHSEVKAKKQEANSRLGINLSMSFEEMGSRMVDADYECKLDKERLKTTLLGVLKEASARRAG